MWNFHFWGKCHLDEDVLSARACLNVEGSSVEFRVGRQQCKCESVIGGDRVASRAVKDLSCGLKSRMAQNRDMVLCALQTPNVCEMGKRVKEGN